jgi:hypothetical protein
MSNGKDKRANRDSTFKEILDMLLFYGRRNARIKKYTVNDQSCKSCRTFDIEVNVYREFYHLYYIPFCPVGDKTVNARCNNCGEPFRSDSFLTYYKEKSRTPFYYFSLPILFTSLVILMTVANRNTQKEKLAFVLAPKVGDVYTIRNEESNKTTYYFLKLNSIKGDTLVMHHGALEYNGFISKMNDHDYFVKEEELFLTKKQLKTMLDRMEINNIERDD